MNTRIPEYMSTWIHGYMNTRIPMNKYFTVPHLFLQKSSHSSRIPVEPIGILLVFHWNKNGIKQTKVEILIYLSQFLKLCRYINFSLSLPFLHNVYSSTLPLKFNFNFTLFLRACSAIRNKIFCTGIFSNFGQMLQTSQKCSNILQHHRLEALICIIMYF